MPNMISDAFEPYLLRTFVAVCHHGSLSGAAQQAGRAQSALSAQIRRLEELLGQRLLRRTGRGVVPTTEGELLLSYATRILALGETVATRLKERTVMGTVRVGLSEDVAVSALPAALGRLRRASPHVHMDITVDHGDALAERWHDGLLDVAIGVSSVFAADPVQTWNMPLYWVSGIDDEIDPALALDVIVYAEPCAWRRLMFDALLSAGRDFRVTVTSPNIGVIMAAVESGLGVALLPAENIRLDTMRVIALGPNANPALSVNYGLFAVPRQTDSIRATVALLSESFHLMTQPRASGLIPFDTVNPIPVPSR
ncbi:LysR family transcriptional regulator [Pseudomonas pergaminensis]|uniref:LysR family transcriptional regulator n=1 Tax=Pseudomonas pergaminensis TaxID=2853159 RepID=UPI0034D716C3